MKNLLKSLLTLFFLLATGYSSIGQQSSFEKAAYNFINQYFKNFKQSYKLDINLVPFTSRALDLKNDVKNHFTDEKYTYYRINMDTVFSEGDYQYLQKQILFWNDTTHLKIEKLKLDTSKIFTSDSRNEMEKMFPSFSIYNITVALFSKDKKTVLVYVSNFCGQ